MQTYRFPAEWEPQSAVQLTWPHPDTDWAGPHMTEVHQTFAQIARQISLRQRLLIACPDPEQVSPWLDGCPAENIRWVTAPSNDSWARDHAPLTVINDGLPILLDFTFNGWGLKFTSHLDNALSRHLHQHGAFGQIPMETTGIVLEGGSVESDGQGTILTTAECLLSYHRNPTLGRSGMEEMLRRWLGTERVLWLDSGYLEGDDTDSHIDTLARFCSPSRIAYVQCTDSTDPHYPALKAMEEQLHTFRQANGAPYELVPLPMTTACYGDENERLPATYANFLIINGAVLAPVYGVPEDAPALEALQVCFPEHEIVPINCYALIRQHGSLHCVTMQYPEGVVQ